MAQDERLIRDGLGSENLTVKQQDIKKLTPTLLIGLGGTGGEVLARVRDRFVEEEGIFQEQRYRRYLWIDTDIRQNQATAWFQQFAAMNARFRDTEKIDASVSSLANYRTRTANNSHIHRWLPTGLPSKVSITEGTGAIRPYGRLAFYAHAGQIHDAISRALGDLASCTDEQALLKQGYELSNKLQAIVVCSLAGGTGSSMFLDTAYLIRHLGESVARRQTEVIGYLALPTIFGPAQGWSRNYANGYAALKELNHYNYEAPLIRAQLQDVAARSSDFDFVLQLSPNEMEIHRQDAPFDQCYLIDSFNWADVHRTAREGSNPFYDMMADSVYQELELSEFGASKRSDVENLKSITTTQQPADPGAQADGQAHAMPRRYWAFGTASIVFPVDQIRRAMGARLARDVLAHMLRDGDANEQTLDAYLDEVLLPRLRLVEGRSVNNGANEIHQVINALLAHEGHLLLDKAADAVESIARGARELGTDRGGTPWHEEIKLKLRALDKEFNRVANREGESVSGEYVRIIAKNATQYQQSVETALVDHFRQQLAAYEGLGYQQAAAVVTRLVKRIQGEEGYMAYWASEAATWETDVQTYQERLDGKLHDLAQAWNQIIFRGRALEEALRAVVTEATNLYQAKLNLLAHTLAAGVGKRLVQVLNGSVRSDHTAPISSLLESSIATLGALHTEMEKRYQAYAARNAKGFDLLLYEGEQDLNALWIQFEDQIKREEIFDAMLRAMDREQPAENSTQLLPPMLAVSHGKADLSYWVKKLAEEAEAPFTKLLEDPAYDVRERFDRVYRINGEVRDAHLTTLVRNSQPWVSLFPEARQNTPSNHTNILVGMRSPERSGDLKRSLEDRFGTNSPIEYPRLRSRSHIALLTILAGYLLRDVQSIGQLREQYIRQVASGERGFHIEKDERKYQDLAELTMREKEEQRGLWELFIQAEMMGVLRASLGPVGVEFSYIQDMLGQALHSRLMGSESGVLLQLSQSSEDRNALGDQTRDVVRRLREGAFEGIEAKHLGALVVYWQKWVYPPRFTEDGTGHVVEIVTVQQMALAQIAKALAEQARDPVAWTREIRELATLIGKGDTFTENNAAGRPVLRITQQ